ncbi:MAG: hypothetical protein WA060_00140 [Minisyncoccia bacterium]
MSYLSYLKQPKQKQKLNALLHIYELYKDVIYNYLNKPTHPSTKNLNIFYIRELKPTILKLVKELHLDAMIAKKEIELSKNYILFTSLLVAEKELQDQGKDAEYARKEVTNNYGKIKELSEFAVAVMQDPIPEIEEIIGEGRRLINTLELTQTKQNSPEIIINDKEEEKYRFPHKLPRGTKWENFIIKFLDEESVLIKVFKFERTATYREMGFIGRGKNPEPSVAWAFLKVLAKRNGELTIRDPEAKTAYKKQKEILSKVLENYFLIEYDPFYPYNRTESYKDYDSKKMKKFTYQKREMESFRIKITLIPPPDLVESKKEKSKNTVIEEKEDEDDPLGIKEYLNEQYPDVYREDEDD